jgi:tRNA(adenine34) deaminase
VAGSKSVKERVVDDVQAMERAIALAREAAARGDQPYGSVIVLDGRIIGEGQNRTITELDPTAHAESEAIRRACREVGRLDLGGATIYASGEPCWACSSAIRAARLSRVLYAVPSFWGTGGATSSFPILTASDVSGLTPPPEVRGGLLDGQMRAIYADLGWPPRAERR